MTVSRFHARVGRRYVRSSVDSATANDTFAAREAMANIVNEFQRFVDHVEEQAPEILLEALQPTFDLSQKYVPKDTGALSASGYLNLVVSRSGSHVVEIGYGKNGIPNYAAKVHENLEFRHKAPTQAKFLQRALEEDEAGIKRRIIELTKQAGGL